MNEEKRKREEKRKKVRPVREKERRNERKRKKITVREMREVIKKIVFFFIRFELQCALIF